ncbi:MAG: ribonuclease P protein component [Prevotella sp.]|nr:ribonuclease P protein component [Prevotella sp.]
MFSKEERLCSRSLIEKLFNGDSAKSVMSFPLRVVYMTENRACDGARVKILVSVPKRYFKHAVDRNRIKRQLREAYRKHKTILSDTLAAQDDGKTMAIAFVWTDGSHRKSAEIEHRVKNLLLRIAEKLQSV